MKAKFALGAVVMTPGVKEDFEPGEVLVCLARHASGDWGDVDLEDKRSNDFDLIHGGRLLSSYQVSGHRKLWIITEADRSTTTLLLPEEY